MVRRYKSISLALLATIFTLGAGIFLTGCFNFGSKQTHEVTQITYDVNHRFTRAWQYAESDMMHAINPAGMRFIFDVELKNSAGETVIGQIDLSEHSTRAFIHITGDYSSSNRTLNVEMRAISNTTIASSVPLEITFSSDSKSSLKLVESVTVTVYYDIIRAPRNWNIVVGSNFNRNYQIGDALDLTGAYVDLTYFDDSTESVAFEQILTLPKFNGSRVDNFNTQTAGLRRSMGLHLEVQGRGTRTQPVNYNVLPDSAKWTQQSPAGFNYWTTSEMILGTTSNKGTTLRTVEIHDSNFNAQFAIGHGYTMVLLNPSNSTFQGFINRTDLPVFNAHLLANQTAQVTSFTAHANYHRINYNVIEGGVVVSTNTMFFYRTGTTNNESLITMVVKASNLLTQNEQELLTAFADLVWFR
jgi:hypothetical protein